MRKRNDVYNDIHTNVHTWYQGQIKINSMSETIQCTSNMEQVMVCIMALELIVIIILGLVIKYESWKTDYLKHGFLVYQKKLR